MVEEKRGWFGRKKPEPKPAPAEVQRQPRPRMTNSVSIGPGSEVRSEEALRFTKVAVLCCLFNFLQIVVKHA